jgi:hypothetical protein
VKSKKSKSKDCTAKIDMFSTPVFFFQPVIPSAPRKVKSQKLNLPKRIPLMSSHTLPSPAALLVECLWMQPKVK